MFALGGWCTSSLRQALLPELSAASSLFCSPGTKAGCGESGRMCGISRKKSLLGSKGPGIKRENGWHRPHPRESGCELRELRPDPLENNAARLRRCAGSPESPQPKEGRQIQILLAQDQAAWAGRLPEYSGLRPPSQRPAPSPARPAQNPSQPSGLQALNC